MIASMEQLNNYFIELLHRMVNNLSVHRSWQEFRKTHGKKCPFICPSLTINMNATYLTKTETEALIQDIHRLGITLRVDGDNIWFNPQSSMIPDLLYRLRNHKKEVISNLTASVYTNSPPPNNGEKAGAVVRGCQNPPPVGNYVLRPDHPHADFDHDAAFGPTPRFVQHKDKNCESTIYWQHIWGSFHCLECWPSTDPSMIIETEDRPIPRRELGSRGELETTWTSEESALIDWFNRNIDSLPSRNFQHEINLAGLQQKLRYRLDYSNARKAISELRILKSENRV